MGCFSRDEPDTLDQWPSTSGDINADLIDPMPTTPSDNDELVALLALIRQRHARRYGQHMADQALERGAGTTYEGCTHTRAVCTLHVANHPGLAELFGMLDAIDASGAEARIAVARDEDGRPVQLVIGARTAQVMRLTEPTSDDSTLGADQASHRLYDAGRAA